MSQVTVMRTAEELIAAALAVLQAMLGPEHAHAADQAGYVTDQLALAARAHVAAVDALPASDRPAGW